MMFHTDLTVLVRDECDFELNDVPSLGQSAEFGSKGKMLANRILRIIVFLIFSYNCFSHIMFTVVLNQDS